MATILNFDPTMSVANKLLDRQHEAVINLGNKALTYLSDDKAEGRGRFRTNLYEFRVRLLDHFYTEEEILFKYEYPMLSEHIIEHGQYMEKLSYLYFDVCNGRYSEQTLKHYLSDGLLEHMVGWDMKYEALFHKKNASR